MIKINLFFMHLAAICKKNIDIIYYQEFCYILNKINVKELHSINMPSLKHYDDACYLIYNFLKNKEIYFTYTYIDKKLHAILNLFEGIFDAGLNKGVPWNLYWIKEERNFYFLEFINLVNHTDIHKIFWNKCIKNSNLKNAEENFLLCINLLKQEISQKKLHHTVNKIFSQALLWAENNIEVFDFRDYYIKNPNKTSNNINTPNCMFLCWLLKHIELIQQKKFKNKPCKILHDRQKEFQNHLKQAYEILSNEALKDCQAGRSLFDDVSMQILPKSNFSFSEAQNSIGIQIADMALSVIAKNYKNKQLSKKQQLLFDLVQTRTLLTYSFTEQSLQEELPKIYKYYQVTSILEKITPDTIRKREEKRIQNEMQKYSKSPQ